MDPVRRDLRPFLSRAYDFVRMAGSRRPRSPSWAHTRGCRSAGTALRRWRLEDLAEFRALGSPPSSTRATPTRPPPRRRHGRPAGDLLHAHDPRRAADAVRARRGVPRGRSQGAALLSRRPGHLIAAATRSTRRSRRRTRWARRGSARVIDLTRSSRSTSRR